MQDLKEISLKMKSGTLCTTISMETDKDTEKEFERLSGMSSEDLKKEFQMNDDIQEELFVELN